MRTSLIKGWAHSEMRDDKGREYMSREFKAFCINHGIQRQHSARNYPQQNGVAERANRTIEGVCHLYAV
jgi:transposase InsO family protein